MSLEGGWGGFWRRRWPWPGLFGIKFERKMFFELKKIWTENAVYLCSCLFKS